MCPPAASQPCPGVVNNSLSLSLSCLPHWVGGLPTLLLPCTCTGETRDPATRSLARCVQERPCWGQVAQGAGVAEVTERPTDGVTAQRGLQQGRREETPRVLPGCQAAYMVRRPGVKRTCWCQAGPGAHRGVQAAGMTSLQEAGRPATRKPLQTGLPFGAPLKTPASP